MALTELLKDTTPKAGGACRRLAFCVPRSTRRSRASPFWVNCADEIVYNAGSGHL